MIEVEEDDGSAQEQFVEAIRGFRARELGEAAVLDVLRGCRFLVPLVAEPTGEETGKGTTGEGTSDASQVVHKGQELALVTVAGPDGRAVLPAFSSVAAMAAWNPSARPVPTSAVRVALAAVAEGIDLVVLDATTWTEFAIRRPALWALARAQPWIPSYLDPEVLSAVMAAAESEPSVLVVQLAPGDEDARLTGPELLVQLSVAAGLDRRALDAVIVRLRERWAESPVIAERVDSVMLQLVGAQ